VGLLLTHMLTGEVCPRSEDAGAHPERAFGPQVPAAVRGLVMEALVRSPEPRAPDMGSVANALWVELNRVREHEFSAVQDPPPTVRPRAQWRTVGMGALIVAVLALGAWTTWYRRTAPAPMTSVIQAVPIDLPALAPPPVPRTQTIPPKEPVVKRMPERAQGTPDGRVTAPHVSTRDIAPPLADAERSETMSRLPVRAAPEGGVARSEPRSEADTPDPSAIIDWLLKESQRQQR